MLHQVHQIAGYFGGTEALRVLAGAIGEVHSAEGQQHLRLDGGILVPHQREGAVEEIKLIKNVENFR